MKDTMSRYQIAIRRLGGAPGLLSLPESIKEVLKETTDLETKVLLLELIAEEI